MITDAGTPAISDPGYLLVHACIERGIEVECLPGATAFVPALVISGLPSDRFVFEGFLPVKKGRQTKLQAIASSDYTTILYESPHRIVKTLEQLSEHMGAETKVAAVREISKLYEEVVRGSLAEVIQHFTEHEPRGEFVLIVGKSTVSDKKQNTIDPIHSSSDEEDRRKMKRSKKWNSKSNKRMTKRLVLGAAVLLTLASCGKNSGEYQTLKQQYDSLALINQNYEAELHETDSLVVQCPDGTSRRSPPSKG